MPRLAPLRVRNSGGVDAIGGMPVMRRLGSGSRSTVWLARGAEGLVAVKVLEPRRDPAEAFAEGAVLWAARGPHVVRLHRGVTDDHGKVALVLEPLLHRVPHMLDAGEAATLLAAAVQEIARLHRLRIVHGALGPDAVRLDERGRPVLIGFGRGRADASEEELSRERAALVYWAASVLAESRPRSSGEAAAVEELIGVLGRIDPLVEWTEDFVRRLLDRIEPAPIPLDAGDRDGAHLTEPPRMPRPRAIARGAQHGIGSRRVAASVEPARSKTGRSARPTVAERVRGIIGQVRRRYLVMGMAALACGALAIALAASGDGAVDGGSEIITAEPSAEAAAPAPTPTPTPTPAASPRAVESAVAAAERLAQVRNASLVDVIGDAAIVEARSGDGSAVRILLVEGPDGWQISSAAEVER